MAEKFADKLQKIEDGVVGGYQKIEDGVTGAFGKIEKKFTGAFLNEDGSLKTGKVGEKVTGAYHKMEDAFVDTFAAKEGESVEEAKARMIKNQEELEAKMKADAEARKAAKDEMIKKSIEASQNAGLK